MGNETCSRCNDPLPVQGDSFTTGYGVDLDDNKVCYACCTEEDRQWMEGHDKITLYLDGHTKPSGKKNYAVTNWPGSLRMPCSVSVGRHNWGLIRHDVWFKDHTGRRWHGVHIGHNTDQVHCRKLKA